MPARLVVPEHPDHVVVPRNDSHEKTLRFQGLIDAPEGPPDGTVSDVTDWVDGDPVRARQALTAEQNRTNPRTSLVDALTDALEG